MIDFTNNIIHKTSKFASVIKYRIGFQRILVVAVIVFSLYIALKFNNKIAATGVVLVLLSIPAILSNVKTFFVALIALKMVINGMYSVNIFGNINVLMIIGGGVPLFLIIYMFIKKIDLKTYPLHQIILLFVAEILFSSALTLYGMRQFSEIDKLMRILNGITCYFAMPMIFKDEKDVKLFLNAWLISLGFPLVIGLYQIFANTLNFQVQTVGNVELYRAAGIYHDVGTIAFSGLNFIVILLFYFSKIDKGLKNILCYVLIGLVSFIIYRTYSRTFAITLAVSLILFSIYSVMGNYANSYKKKFLLVMSAFIIFSIFFTESSGIYKRIEKDIGDRGKFGDEVVFSGRIGMWRRNWDVFNSFTPLQKLLGHQVFGAHNDFLRVLLDNGILGLILYITMLMSILIKLFISFHRQQNSFYRNLIFIAFLSQVNFIIICLATTPSLMTDYQWFHWGLVGIALFQLKNKKSQ